MKQVEDLRILFEIRYSLLKLTTSLPQKSESRKGRLVQPSTWAHMSVSLLQVAQVAINPCDGAQRYGIWKFGMVSRVKYLLVATVCVSFFLFSFLIQQGRNRDDTVWCLLLLFPMWSTWLFGSHTSCHKKLSQSLILRSKRSGEN